MKNTTTTHLNQSPVRALYRFPGLASLFVLAGLLLTVGTTLAQYSPAPPALPSSGNSSSRTTFSPAPPLLPSDAARTQATVQTPAPQPSIPQNIPTPTAYPYPTSAPSQVSDPFAPPFPTPTPSIVQRVPAAGFTKIPTLATREENFKLPLRKLIGLNDTIVMRNASSYYTFFVPQSARVKVKSANFHLEFTNSIALLTERSVIRVVCNDVIIAQYYLDRNKPFNTVDIAIPLNLMKIGFNRLQLVAVQHYTYKCEDPASPELYTEINPDTSYLSATGEWKDVPERLSYLRWWIDEKLWTPYQFNVCLPSSGGQVSDEDLSLGSTVTQGVALALNNEQFRVFTANALRPGMDNIVIGTARALSGFLTSTEIDSVKGCFLAIKSLPGDPTHCMIIVSGGDSNEVAQSAWALGLVNFPLPDSKYATFDPARLPDKPVYLRNAPINGPGVYSFRQLGFLTRAVNGWHTGGFSLNTYMPGDISKDDQSNVELRLHFVYGAALRKDSTLDVFVNKQFQTAIRLDDIRGSLHTDHRLYLPIQAFQPGLNTVDLMPNMIPLISSECEIVQDMNLHFTLYDDSDFVFPNAQHRARLPNLGIFSQTSYPYSAPPDGSETAIFVAGKDPETVCAAWTLLGKMAQISGALLQRAEILYNMPPGRTNKSLIVVGPRDQIPDDLVKSAPIAPLKVGNMRYLVSKSPKPEKLAASSLEEFMAKIRGIPTERGEPENPATAEMLMASDMIDDTVAVQFQAPGHPGYPVTLFTANDGPRLLAGINALQDRRIWDSLAGDVAVWNTDLDSLATAKVGPNFIYKQSNPISRAGTKLEGSPYLFTLILLVVLLLIGLVVTWVLKRRQSLTAPPTDYP
ncbi:hypothetical protein BH09VER1_BH09VER1_30370 [soil metagenome]